MTFLRATLHASNGAEGAPGQKDDPGAITKVSSGTLDAQGNAASGATGGASKQCTCSTAPVIDGSTTIVVGSAGSGGKGGKSPMNDGPAGVATNTKDAAQL